MSDQVSNLIVKIMNAANAGKENVYVPCTNLNSEILKVLECAGFVEALVKKGRRALKFIEFKLVLDDDRPKVKGVKRLSKLSKRVYFSAKEIRPVRSGFGRLIISTSQGVMTGEEAKQKKIGGEPLFQIW